MNAIRLKALTDAVAAQCYNGNHCVGPDEDHGIGDYFSRCGAFGVWTIIPEKDRPTVLQELNRRDNAKTS